MAIYTQVFSKDGGSAASLFQSLTTLSGSQSWKLPPEGPQLVPTSCKIPHQLVLIQFGSV